MISNYLYYLPRYLYKYIIIMDTNPNRLHIRLSMYFFFPTIQWFHNFEPWIYH